MFKLHALGVTKFYSVCAGNSPVTGEFTSQRTETRSFDVFFLLGLNKRLSKQSRRWWSEMPLWRHCDLQCLRYLVSNWETLGSDHCIAHDGRYIEMRFSDKNIIMFWCTQATSYCPNQRWQITAPLNEYQGIVIHLPFDCLFSSLFKNTSKLKTPRHWPL